MTRPFFADPSKLAEVLQPATSPLIAVRDLTVRFGRSGRDQRPAVRKLSFSLTAGETLAVVGESGCGKSTTALAIMGLLGAQADVSGHIKLGDTDLIGARELTLRRLRGNRMAIIFQEPMSSLNPVHRIVDQIAEPLVFHRGMSWKDARNHALDLLGRVQFSDPSRIGASYSHQLSGGQRQRAAIAIAIACEPDILIADEATSALDVVVQEQILALLDRLRREMSMSLILISHDLPLVARWADRVMVMHHGEKMEELPAARLLEQGAHTYTRGLSDASLRFERHLHYRDTALPEIQSLELPDGSYDFKLHVPAPSLPVHRETREMVLEARSLTVDYHTEHGTLRALDGVDFSVRSGESAGIVGESGSGKSTLARALVRLTGISAGTIILNGEDVTGMREREFRKRRQTIQMVFQDPFGSLNPRMTVDDILQFPMMAHGVSDPAERRARIKSSLEQVKLPEASIYKYPHEFSGGQRQRINIARALILQPSILICDEVVSALDVSVQSKILNLLLEIKNNNSMAMIFITHDISVAQYISDDIYVMKDGRVVERGAVEKICQHPEHPYTRALIAAT